MGTFLAKFASKTNIFLLSNNEIKIFETKKHSLPVETLHSLIISTEPVAIMPPPGYQDIDKIRPEIHCHYKIKTINVILWSSVSVNILFVV